MVHNIHSTIALAKFVKLNHTTTLMSEDQVPAVRLRALLMVSMLILERWRLCLPLFSFYTLRKKRKNQEPPKNTDSPQFPLLLCWQHGRSDIFSDCLVSVAFALALQENSGSKTRKISAFVKASSQPCCLAMCSSPAVTLVAPQLMTSTSLLA